MKSCVALFVIGVLLCAHVSLGQTTCDCNLATLSDCPLTVLREIVGGTARCDADSAASCDVYTCAIGGSFRCVITSVSSYKFTGEGDICVETTIDVVQRVESVGDFLGVPDFLASAPSGGSTIISNMNGPSGTTMYLTFTTGGDVTVPQMLFEAGSNALGVAVQIQNGQFVFYAGFSTSPIALLAPVNTNTFYTILWSIVPNGGGFQIFVGVDEDLLNATLDSLSPASDGPFTDPQLVDPSGYGVGLTNPPAKGVGSIDFIGSGLQLRIWDDTSL
eukprot:CAMPEP_0182446582 /NCGR_PEP_ID=MMETSP1172-20130603/4292_1 /TAXON_ID=708627 /ORGANISM="Timspurckia oligopyrenoides, Strain CCMP3278" /LENGTH=274 /DNA_ID=CAMNT_0024642533 /DNA_START=113 /DNA_END=937 /DNA_ORIENTATION=-